MEPAEVKGLKGESRLPIASTDYKDFRWIGGPATASKIPLSPSLDLSERQVAGWFTSTELAGGILLLFYT
jgi:hypothetical protein